jgi:hypothetical protein
VLLALLASRRKEGPFGRTPQRTASRRRPSSGLTARDDRKEFALNTCAAPEDGENRTTRRHIPEHPTYVSRHLVSTRGKRAFADTLHCHSLVLPLTEMRSAQPRAVDWMAGARIPAGATIATPQRPDPLRGLSSEGKAAGA